MANWSNPVQERRVLSALLLASTEYPAIQETDPLLYFSPIESEKMRSR